MPASELSTEQDPEQVTEQVSALSTVIDDEKYSRLDLMELVGIKHRPTKKGKAFNQS